MRFCIADPPYPGKARKHYGRHADFAGEVDHRELIEKLEADFDAWVLCTSAKALPWILPLCPMPENNSKQPGDPKEGTGARVLAWVKPHSQVGTNSITNLWEPAILRGGRRRWQQGTRPNDVLTASPELYSFRPKPEGYVVGAKPPVWWRWIFDCLGAEPADEFVDLFRGSGAGAVAWAAFCAQPALVNLAKTDRRERERHPGQGALEATG